MSLSDLENGFFPEEVVLQILARLPIKSLFRCKSVCKLWYRLPSNKYFIQLYNEVSSKNPMVLVELIKSFYVKSSFICVDRLRGVSEFSLDFLNDRVKVRASCNGLLCCASVPNKGVYYVCNPLTREFKLLPRTRERPMTRFHPDDEATLVGLAFNVSNQKFNVVLAGFYRPFGHRPLDSFVCVVFDSETNTWRKSISSRSDEFTHMNRNQVVFANGSLHWLTYSCLYILVFDLDNEVWRKISLPGEVIARSGNRVHLLELDGSVSIIQISEAWMNIWALKNYEREEWCTVDKVSLRCIRGLVPSVFPISQTSEFVFLATQRQILVYHRNSRVWKEMYSVKNTFSYPLWFSAHAFRSTLFSCHQGLDYS
ncbi:PREDICTED: F-box protein At5g49610 [Nelumbo nucifera]|uniref:F-box domain-containing protein n=2 Tax=Nelumbo nucifera TaxID=4432 RepID=A0A822YNA6_NELNU|nr:PREDICTED: F-box protein At5g49610 [Nelumbo nucifera]DAD33061.1 TPA_asm: hypothetical protein HUJ06_011912 [Nelumbo nucifera]